MPTLAKEIVDAGDLPTFRGFMVGNPLTYMPYRNYGEIGTFAGHNLLPKPLFDKYIAGGCQANDSPACDTIMNEAEGLVAGMDPYALDFPVCADSAQSAGRHERYTLASLLPLSCLSCLSLPPLRLPLTNLTTLSSSSTFALN